MCADAVLLSISLWNPMSKFDDYTRTEFHMKLPLCVHGLHQLIMFGPKDVMLVLDCELDGYCKD